MISFAQDNVWNRVGEINAKREFSYDEPSKLSRANFALAYGILQARSCGLQRQEMFAEDQARTVENKPC